jgi:hypothetical protein
MHIPSSVRDATAPRGPGPPHYRGFTITFRHTTLGRTPLDEWSARRRDVCVPTHNTHGRERAMTPAGFEPAVPPSGRPQTHVLDRAATGIGWILMSQAVFRERGLTLRVWCCSSAVAGGFIVWRSYLALNTVFSVAAWWSRQRFVCLPRTYIVTAKNSRMSSVGWLLCVLEIKSCLYLTLYSYWFCYITLLKPSGNFIYDQV